MYNVYFNFILFYSDYYYFFVIYFLFVYFIILYFIIIFNNYFIVCFCFVLFCHLSQGSDIFLFLFFIPLWCQIQLIY